jgi:hypothetical protein
MVSPSLTQSLVAARHLPISRSPAKVILLQIKELRAFSMTFLEGETGSTCQPAWQALVVAVDLSGREMLKSVGPFE